MRRLRLVLILSVLSIVGAINGRAGMDCQPGLTIPQQWNPYECIPWSQDQSDCLVCDVTPQSP